MLFCCCCSSKMEVFRLLGYEKVLEQLGDNAYDESDKKKQDTLLKVSGLLYLLQDLEKKVSFKFVTVAANPFQVAPKASDNDRAQFAGLARKSAREVAEQVHKLLLTLCLHLEAINSQLQTLVSLLLCLFSHKTLAEKKKMHSFLFQAQSQSSVADFVTVNEKELAECLRLIFSILNKYLCWIDLPEDLLLVGDDLLQTFAMLLCVSNG